MMQLPLLCPSKTNTFAKTGLEGRDLGVVEVVPAEEVLDDDSPLVQARLDKLQELLRRHVRGDVVGVEGVEPDLIVTLPALLEELSAVVDGQRLAGRNGETRSTVSPVFPRTGPPRRSGAAPGGGASGRPSGCTPRRDRSGRPFSRPAGRGIRRTSSPCIRKSEASGCAEIDTGLAEVALAAEDHAPLPAVLADRDVVVDRISLVEGSDRPRRPAPAAPGEDRDTPEK